MTEKSNKPGPKFRRKTSWDPLANWYDGWVGKGGSKFHRKLAIPTVMDLLQLKPGETVLDVGAGTGVLAPFVARGGGYYYGIDLSGKLLQYARQYHSKQGRFFRRDARNLASIPEFHPQMFDGVIFLLSIQDMDPLEEILEATSWALKPQGRVVILMTHPCFRIPRQSGWGWDENRKLQFRRVDRYLTPLSVPLKPYPGQNKGVSWSFHRPLGLYVNTLAEYGLLVNRILEVPTYPLNPRGKRRDAEKLANQEIPLFLGLRAIKA